MPYRTLIRVLYGMSIRDPANRRITSELANSER